MVVEKDVVKSDVASITLKTNIFVPREIIFLAEEFNGMINKINSSYKELEQKNRELKQLDSFRSNLVDTVSHELRTPLTGILGYTSRLLRTDIKIDESLMIPREDVVVAITKDGYIKRTSFRSYTASNPDDITMKENDYILGMYEMSTTDVILVITSGGNYLHIPVHMLPDLKWKDMPKHVSNIIEMSAEESVIAAIPAYDFNTEANVVIATRNGMIKRSKLKEFKLQRYSKATSCMNLKDDDEVITAFVENDKYIFLASDSGYGLSFDVSEVPLVGVKAAGVKAMKMKDDYLVSVNNFDYNKEEFISILTDKGTGKRVRLTEFEVSTRARRGLLMIREVKTNPYKVLKTFITDPKNYIGIKNGEINNLKLTELPIADRHSIGTLISKKQLTDAFIIATLYRQEKEEAEESKQEEPKIIEVIEVKEQPKKERISLKEIDDRLLTIDDFLN